MVWPATTRTGLSSRAGTGLLSPRAGGGLHRPAHEHAPHADELADVPDEGPEVQPCLLDVPRRHVQRIDRRGGLDRERPQAGAAEDQVERPRGEAVEMVG